MRGGLSMEVRVVARDKEFPLVLLQAKAVSSQKTSIERALLWFFVSISSPSGEGGEQ